MLPRLRMIRHRGLLLGEVENPRSGLKELRQPELRPRRLVTPEGVLWKDYPRHDR